MNKLKKADPDWYTAIVSGTEWEILSRDTDKEEPRAAHTIALALNRKNSAALCTTHMEMLRTLKGLCKPDPRTMEVPWDRVKAQMIKTFGPAARDDAKFAAYQLIVTAGDQVSESWDDFSDGRVISSTSLAGGLSSKHMLLSQNTRQLIVTLSKCS